MICSDGAVLFADIVADARKCGAVLCQHQFDERGSVLSLFVGFVVCAGVCPDVDLDNDDIRAAANTSHESSGLTVLRGRWVSPGTL